MLGTIKHVKRALMAVVEVDKEDRIICQRDGCGHSVYKRIRIVRENGRFTVLGSECFKLLYSSDCTGAAPLYGSSAGQLLTDAEREVLIDSTDRFIAMREAQRLQLGRVVARLASVGTLKARRDSALLQIGFFGGFQRSELVSVEVDHVDWTPQGITITLPRSKTDQLG